MADTLHAEAQEGYKVRLGGAAAIVPKAERLKRFNDARRQIHEAMKPWDDILSRKGASLREGQPER